VRSQFAPAESGPPGLPGEPPGTSRPARRLARSLPGRASSPHKGCATASATARPRRQTSTAHKRLPVVLGNCGRDARAPSPIFTDRNEMLEQGAKPVNKRSPSPAVVVPPFRAASWSRRQCRAEARRYVVPQVTAFQSKMSPSLTTRILWSVNLKCDPASLYRGMWQVTHRETATGQAGAAR